MTPTTGSKTAADIAALLRARNPLLLVVTREEARFERFAMEIAQGANLELRCWDCATGISNINGEPKNGGTSALEPSAALAAIRDSRERQLWILRDMSAWLRDPTVTRGLRSLARMLPMAPRDQARAIILLSPTNDIPPELSGHAIVIEFPLPDRAEIAGLLDAAIAALPDDLKATACPNGARDLAIDSAVGLSQEEATACFSKSLVVERKINPASVASEKKRIITRAGLESVEPIAGGLDAIGGLDNLKAWLIERAGAFTQAARTYGLPTPRGVLLVGQPGCGKSLTAKAVAAAWGVPLLRGDLGALKSKYVGESEGKLRNFFKVVEALGRCVLWFDEIDKVFSGADDNTAADGGVQSDQLGAMLSFMQDRTCEAFIVATANAVNKLPAALLRKGRFDRIFFVDLPTELERIAILKTAMRQHKREAVDIDHAAIAAACNNFTGSEIAALVPDALFISYNDGKRELATADLLTVARGTMPLSRTAAASIEASRQWGKANALPASSEIAATSANVCRLDI